MERSKFDENPAGLEVVPYAQGIQALPSEVSGSKAPQTVPGPEKEVDYTTDKEAIVQNDKSQGLLNAASIRKRKRFWLLLAALALIVIIIIVIAVPLGIRTKKDASPPPSAPPDNSSHGSPPLPGALNGTSIAIISEGLQDRLDYHLFYQNSKSQIRRLEGIYGTSFSGGLPVIPANARDATPLAVASYGTYGTSNFTTHLFYVNTTNFLQELISIDNLTTWKTGPLGASSFAASTSSIALSAVYSSDNLGLLGNSSGMRLYCGGTNNNQVHELAYAFNDTFWTYRFSFPNTNGNAGFVSGLDDINRRAQLIALNNANALTIWNSNLSVARTDAKQPAYGAWVEETHVSPGGIRQNSSISTTGGVDPPWLVFQRPSQALKFVSPPSSNGGTVWGDLNDFTTWDKPQPGTNIAAALFPRGGAGPSELNVFYQTNGSDIIQDADTVGHFHNSTLPVD